MLKASAGLRAQLLAGESLREILNGGYLEIYSGTVPSNSEDAVNGTMLARITDVSASVKTKRVMTYTPTVGDANASIWSVTVNGVECTFTDDGTPTQAEIVTGLRVSIDAAVGLDMGTLNYLTTNAYQSCVTSGTTTLILTAYTAGVHFDSSATVTTNHTTAAMGEVVTTAGVYGLRFEALAGVAAGVIEKLSTQIWSGTVASTGQATYYRFVQDSDAGASDATSIRLQGTVGTSGADLNLSSVQLTSGATQTVDTYTITFPEYST